MCSLFPWLSSFVNSYSPSSVLCCCRTSCINSILMCALFFPWWLSSFVNSYCPSSAHQAIMDLVYSLSFYLVLWLNLSTLLAYIEKEGQRSALFSLYLADNQFVSHLSFFIHLSSSFVPFCLKNPCLLYSQISYYKEVTFLMKIYKCIIIEMRTEKPCAHSIMGVSTFHGMQQDCIATWWQI